MGRTISTGEPATLKTYRKIAIVLTGDDSYATKYFDDQIAKHGEDEEVIVNESQVIGLIMSMAAQ